MSIGMQIGPFVLKNALPQAGPFGGELFEAARRPKKEDIGAFLDAQLHFGNSDDAFPTIPLVVVELLPLEPNLAKIPGGFTVLLKTSTPRGFAILYPAGSESTTQPETTCDPTHSLSLELRPSGSRLGAHYRFNTLPNHGSLVARLVEGPGEPGEIIHEPQRWSQFHASGHLFWEIHGKGHRLKVQVSLEEPSLTGGPRMLCSREIEIPLPATLFWRNSPKGIALWATRRIEEKVSLTASLRGGGQHLMHAESIPGERESLLVVSTESAVNDLNLANEDLRRWLSVQFAGSVRSI